MGQAYHFRPVEYAQNLHQDLVLVGPLRPLGPIRAQATMPRHALRGVAGKVKVNAACAAVLRRPVCGAASGNTCSRTQETPSRQAEDMAGAQQIGGQCRRCARIIEA